MSSDESGDGVQRFEERIEEVHYTALHTALEQYLGKEIPGKLTYAHFPSDEVGHSNVELRFTEVVEDE